MTIVLLRVIEILFPMFSVVLLGYYCSRRTGIDMAPINRLNLDYFAPAFVFSVLVDMPLGSRQINLIYAGLLALLVPGILMWVVCKIKNLDIRIWLPSHMFRNSGNLAIPLFVYTFGQIAKGDAVLLLVISSTLQMTLGLFIVSGANKAGLKLLFRAPLIYATALALFFNLNGITVWPPLQQATELIGASNIPLMLFSLGTQLVYVNRSGLKIGLISTATSLITGAITFLIIQSVVELPLRELQMMVLFTMLPPAVMNYLFAERYKVGGETVAAMVLYGNFFAIFTMPVLLWFALSVVK